MTTQFGPWPPGAAAADVMTWTAVIDTPGTYDVETGNTVNLYDGADPGIVLRFPATPPDGTIVRTKEAVNSGGHVQLTVQGGATIEDYFGGFSSPSITLGESDFNVSLTYAYEAAGNTWRMLNFYRPDTVP